MRETNIRFAIPNDAIALAALRLELRSHPGENVEDEEPFLNRCVIWMENALQQPHWRCWVAEENQVLVGALWLQVVEKIPNPTSEEESFAYITNFFVSESVRGQGVGSRILTNALKWCREQNVHAAVLWPTQRSRSLYERHGFSRPNDLLEVVFEATQASAEERRRD
ncbi:MAG: N-acetyltransferase family protein [Pyrinomonadaceae bacterium]